MIRRLGCNQEEGLVIEHNYKLETIDGNKVVLSILDSAKPLPGYLKGI
jgi:hypothetical protein